MSTRREYGYRGKTGGPRYQGGSGPSEDREPDVVIDDRPLDEDTDEVQLSDAASKPEAPRQEAPVVVDDLDEDTATPTAPAEEEELEAPADTAKTDSLLDEMKDEEDTPEKSTEEETGELPETLTGFMDMDSKRLTPAEAKKKAEEDAKEEAADQGAGEPIGFKDPEPIDKKPTSKKKGSKPASDKRSK